jgi:multisubunit Na+/H+ antiporter MnhB subunit
MVAGLVVLAVGIALLLLGARSTARQIRRAGADPSQGEFAYHWQGGTSKRTSVVVLLGWCLIVVGVVLLVVALA